jgi:hypothetical protein
MARIKSRRRAYAAVPRRWWGGAYESVRARVFFYARCGNSEKPIMPNDDMKCERMKKTDEVLGIVWERNLQRPAGRCPSNGRGVQCFAHAGSNSTGSSIDMGFWWAQSRDVTVAFDHQSGTNACHSTR